MYLIDKDEVLSFEKMADIIQSFEFKDKPILENYNNYYLGKQAILNKTVSDASKPCNRIVVNYCQSIVSTFAGYLTSIDITYSSNEDITDIQDILNYNDVASVDSELLVNALKFGVAYEIAYLDEDSKQRFKVLDSREIIPVYVNDLDNDLALVIRYFPVDNTKIDSDYYVEVYTREMTYTYKANHSLTSFSLIKEQENFYKQVPITVFELNVDRQSIFAQIMTLQDAYNTLLSSSTDDWEAFCDAYMVLSEMDVDPEELSMMRENRVLVIPSGGDAKYLTKDINTTQVQALLQNANDNIHKIANCPDFSQESFGTSSGIALRHRLLGFQNVAGTIEKRMTRALQRRIELICSILSITNGEDIWKNIEIRFTKNLPVDLNETVNVVNSLRGLVSDKTLLAQLPFISNVELEMEQLEEQKKQNVSLYSFSNYEEVEPTDE